MFDMLGNSRSPDCLTYKTVLEGLCREGRVDDAFELLDECKKRDIGMNERMYKTLFNDLQFVCRD
jgi:pentatricopeptide repeat protein